MNRAWMMSIALSFTAAISASFAAGCMAAPGAGEGSVIDADEALVAPEAARGEASLSCPGAGTCAKADSLCGAPNSESWCSILTTCMSCYPDGWLTAEPPAAAKAEAPAAAKAEAPAAIAPKGEASASCPAAGTCAKADSLCGAPNSESWCSILNACYACGYPY